MSPEKDGVGPDPDGIGKGEQQRSGEQCVLGAESRIVHIGRGFALRECKEASFVPDPGKEIFANVKLEPVDEGGCEVLFRCKSLIVRRTVLETLAEAGSVAPTVGGKVADLFGDDAGQFLLLGFLVVEKRQELLAAVGSDRNTVKKKLVLF